MPAYRAACLTWHALVPEPVASLPAPQENPQLLPLLWSSIWKAAAATYLSRASRPGRLYWTAPPSSAPSRLFPPPRLCPQPRPPQCHSAYQEPILQGPPLVLTQPAEIKGDCKLFRKKIRSVCQTRDIYGHRHFPGQTHFYIPAEVTPSTILSIQTCCFLIQKTLQRRPLLDHCQLLAARHCLGDQRSLPSLWRPMAEYF